MFLRSLSLFNFKNYAEAEFAFSAGVNVFTGDNGSGKTNLLDAIHYLCMCKSYFSRTDAQNIRKGEQFFAVNGTFVLDDKEEQVSCGLKQGQKKQVKRNGREYEKLSEHIGLLPCVVIAPVDLFLITEGSEERRKFIDSIIAQLDQDYLQELIRYMRILGHRNALLRQPSHNGNANQFLLWDEQLVSAGKAIYAKRRAFTGKFIPVFEKYYSFISGESEAADMTYDSQLHSSAFEDLLLQSAEKDRVLQFTTAGIHKDDFLFSIEGFGAKRYGSQGQQKSCIIALKLAQFEIMSAEKKFKPVLLLDDIFEKLDHNRISRLMEMVSHHTFGQLFITDTHKERIMEIFDSINVPVNLLRIENGAAVNET